MSSFFQKNILSSQSFFTLLFYSLKTINIDKFCLLNRIYELPYILFVTLIASIDKSLFVRQIYKRFKKGF